jgi:ABC-type branched-subunit amino acid transport system ATPase component
VVEHLTVDRGGVTIVDDVSITVGAGEVVGLTGPNGAGKTTVFDAVCGLVAPRRGTVIIGGRNVRRTPAHIRARLGVARTFQTPPLLDDLTAQERLAVAAGPTGRFEDGPRFDDQAVHGPAGRSIVARRRLAVSIAMARAPQLLMLDEPATGLDGRERADLAAGIRQAAASGVGVLLCDHDPRFVAEVCDRVLPLGDRPLVVPPPAGAPLAGGDEAVAPGLVARAGADFDGVDR